jgi:hypothetical protein
MGSRTPWVVRGRWLLAVGVAAAAFEGTVRLDDWARFGVPLRSGVASLGELLVRDSLGAHPRPGAAFRFFRINALGFRGPEVPDLPNQAWVIAVSGASETFGLYERPGREWPRQLEDSLRRRCGTPVQVLNAGFAGMTMPSVMQDVERRLAPLQPNIGVYYPTPAQYLEGARPVASRPVHDPSPPPPAWRPRGAARLLDAIKRAVPIPLLDLIRQLETRRQRRASGRPPIDTVPLDRLAAFEEDLRRLVGTYRRVGMMPALVVHRHRFGDTLSVEARRSLRAWERFYPGYTGRTLITFDDSAAARTRLVASDSQVLVVDPLEPLRNLGARAFSDFVHFTDDGAALVGGRVAVRLTDEALAGFGCRRPARGAPPQAVRPTLRFRGVPQT